jgi:serine/threonine protein kinase
VWDKAQVPRSGQILAGKYRLVSELGKGGMGSVWCAEHLMLHSKVALKLIEPTRADSEESAGQFLREARMAAGLNSQHVVKIFDYGLADDTPFIAMELLDGETLRQRIVRAGRLTLEAAQRVVRQIAHGVERAHRAGIVHRDLKPDNVFIVDGEEAEIVKVLDFGIAKSTGGALGESISPATPTGALLGTPHYMSPEQAMGSRELDHRTDLWSLGVLAFECLLGQVPFQGETLGSLIVAVCSLPLPVPSQRGRVPVGFDAWFARACAREPAARFGSARELADAFGELHASSETPPAAPPLGTRAEPFGHTMLAVELSKKARAWPRWILIPLLLGAGSIPWLFLRSPSGAEPPPGEAVGTSTTLPVSPAPHATEPQRSVALPAEPAAAPPQRAAEPPATRPVQPPARVDSSPRKPMPAARKSGAKTRVSPDANQKTSDPYNLGF